MTDYLRKKIDFALDEIRPHLQVDGGDIEIVDITPELTLLIKWLGNCENCHMASMTMRAGIEDVIRRQVPEIKDIVAINGVHSKAYDI